MKAILLTVADHELPGWRDFMKATGNEFVTVDVRRFTEAKALAEWQESHLNPCREEPTP